MPFGPATVNVYSLFPDLFCIEISPWAALDWPYFPQGLALFPFMVFSVLCLMWACMYRFSSCLSSPQQSVLNITTHYGTLYTHM